ncbi:MAG: response regulator transcription factor [Herbaspirillum sp.]
MLVDDHTIFRSGLRRLFSDEPDLCITDEASNGGDALAKLRTQTFDIILLDINMEGRSGLDVLTSIRAEFQKLPVLLLSMFPEEQYALTGLKAGANGYVSKDIDAAELTHAIRQVVAGEKYLSPRAAKKILAQLNSDDNRPPHQKLSGREYQIMLMIINGVSLTEIGEKMFISVKTVSTYRRRILNKMTMTANTELVLYAVRQGLIG